MRIMHELNDNMDDAWSHDLKQSFDAPCLFDFRTKEAKKSHVSSHVSLTNMTTNVEWEQACDVSGKVTTNNAFESHHNPR